MPTGRWSLVVELAVCAILVSAVALNAMRRMDYFGAHTAQQIRMTDESRTAYVAKNLAEGNGYTTNDLPAALIDFYDHHGKLHAAHWVNADRFPFAAYLTAAIYVLTGSTSWKVGILAYNIVCFVAFFVVLYAFSRTVWRDRYAGLLAVTLALLHAYTFQFLYWKDADMLLLTTITMWALYRYFARPDAMTWKLAVGLGTLFAFVFLARPNLGVAFILSFLFVTARRMWRMRGDGARAIARHFARREWLALIVGFLWCVPFMVYSLREWGTPLFSANSLYQLPLGTRFGMGTDTWWKYTEPGHPVTLARLLHAVPGEIVGKFTSSWIATLKTIVGFYAVELALACGLIAWLGRRSAGALGDSPDVVDAARPVRQVAAVIGFALISNLALLPLYGYQALSYHHYLGFGLPLLWLCAGRALAMIASRVRPALDTAIEHVRRHASLYLALAVLAVLAWNFGAPASPTANRLFPRTSNFASHHWFVLALALVAVVARRWVLRPPWFPRLAVLACGLVFVSYRPSRAMKRANVVWFPANDRVWDALRDGHGLVSSFALQGEVAWNTGRENIPAPEWPMHIYSFLFDHQLQVEDLYIESADALIGADGPFTTAAAGFEGYARLQRYRTLPGYAVTYHAESTRTYPKFGIKALPKASTVFHLVDPAAVAAMAHSPDEIALGDPQDVIYTAHGWGDYYTIDGKRVVAGTDVTRRRYGNAPGPWEDSGITFFLDARRPSSFDLEIYAPVPGSYTFYWNLDLYAWDPPSDRAAHALGTYTATAPGWQRVHFSIPAGLMRRGLNKLGFRASEFQPVVLCPQGEGDAVCLQQAPPTGDPRKAPPRVVHVADLPVAASARVSVFAQELDFHYDTP